LDQFLSNRSEHCVGFVCFNLFAVTFGLLVLAKEVVGKTGFCTSQVIGWEDRLQKT